MVGGIKIRKRRILIGLIAMIALQNICFSQCTTGKDVWDSIIVIENATGSNNAKLQRATQLLKKFDGNTLCKDSVYARLLHRIATLQYLQNGEIATKESVDLMLRSIAVNSSGKIDAAPDYVINSYFNLGVFYKSLGLNSKALIYYDSVLIVSKARRLQTPLSITCRVLRADMLFQRGDYQKCIDECIAGLSESKGQNEYYATAQLFNRRAQSYLYLTQLENAYADSDAAFRYAGAINNKFEQATSIIIQASINAQWNKKEEAQRLFEKAIALRKTTGEYKQIADDYTDWGNFLINKLKRFKEAQNCYLKTIAYAQKAGDAERVCKGYINLGETAFRLFPQDAYAATRMYYKKALQVYGLQSDSFLQTPLLKSFSAIANTDMLLALLNNRTELLLHLYKATGEEQYFNACVAAALLTDSAISQARHEQAEEMSKLYWRNKTRLFFANALEACYLAKDMSHAFYFMEKSRAVLLGDKLSELGAAAQLPPNENILEQNYKAAIVYAQQQLMQADPHAPGYPSLQLKLVEAKERLEDFIALLERKYPAYFQYRYVDVIPAITELQLRLRDSRQSFVYNFLQDTSGFILVVQPDTAKMIRLQNSMELTKQMDTFMHWCSDKQQQNNHYADFAALAHQLYKILFAPLRLKGRRVVLCQDNILLPFEALCIDTKGGHFLVNDYQFSYVYSARYFMNDRKGLKSKGDFIGFAPVSFRKNLWVPDLKYSASALEHSASVYHNVQLFTGIQANRNSFLEQSSHYSIVNVFSHAMADTGSTEPLLYMQDSVIHLSELQLMYRPSIQLMMLSACQTNVGRVATGEGIYSLARGFSAAGIPAVAATLWKADEDAIYALSAKFNAFLSEGRCKDEALQKAKLYFMQQGDKESLLPYYWANMILMGNAEPVKLNERSAFFWWMLVILLIAGGMLIYNKGFKQH